MIKLFNDEFIVSIEIHDKKECRAIKYHEKTKSVFSLFSKQAGFYLNESDFNITNEAI